MRSEDFDFLYSLEEHYWWFAGMRQVTDAIVRADLKKPHLRILDAGCGTGYNLNHYAALGHSLYGLDVAAEAVDGVKKRGVTKIVQASVTDIPYRSESFDLVFSFDVVCQIPVDADPQAIAEMHRVLKRGGVLFVRTPAFEWLRSSHDADLHTQHRFHQAELAQLLTRAGFKIRFATYANTLLFPIVVMRRFLKRLGIGSGTDVKPLPKSLAWVDPIFRNALGMESVVFRRNGRFPFGLSVILYAEKS